MPYWSTAKCKVFLTLTLCFISFVPTANAWGGHIIRPGEHVFDATRFKDSVKETMQQALFYSQLFDKLQNMLNMNKKINLSEQILHAIKITDEKLNVSGLMNTLNLEDITSLRIDEFPSFGGTQKKGVAAMNDKDAFEHSVLSEHGQSNANALNVAQQILYNLGSHQTNISNVLKIETDSVHAEEQKGFALDGIIGVQQNESLRIKGANLIHKIEREQLAREETEFNEEVAKAKQEIYNADPYHPTEFDESMKEHLPVKTSGFGFPDL